MVAPPEQHGMPDDPETRPDAGCRSLACVARQTHLPLLVWDYFLLATLPFSLAPVLLLATLTWLGGQESVDWRLLMPCGLFGLWAAGRQATLAVSRRVARQTGVGRILADQLMRPLPGPPALLPSEYLRNGLHNSARALVCNRRTQGRQAGWMARWIRARLVQQANRVIAAEARTLAKNGLVDVMQLRRHLAAHMDRLLAEGLFHRLACQIGVDAVVQIALTGLTLGLRFGDITYRS